LEQAVTKFFATFGVIAAISGSGALAATCADRDHVVRQLEVKFDETLIANAVNPSNQVLEVYGSRDNDTWSVVVYLPERNLSCLAATGRGLDRLSAEMQLQF
jgi:hypothetical protein